MEAHILPIMRAHGIRYVQVARRGHFEVDGITVLDDSRNPQRVFLDGDYKLSDELALNGTVPQYGGVHRCALKFKAWVIERWLNENIRGNARHAIGYNCEEQSRMAKSEYAFAERIAFGFNVNEKNRVERSCEYNTFTREAFCPLLEWGWLRQDCQNSVVWSNSAARAILWFTGIKHSLQATQVLSEWAKRLPFAGAFIWTRQPTNRTRRPTMTPFGSGTRHPMPPARGMVPCFG